MRKGVRVVEGEACKAETEYRRPNREEKAAHTAADRYEGGRHWIVSFIKSTYPMVTTLACSLKVNSLLEEKRKRVHLNEERCPSG